MGWFEILEIESLDQIPSMWRQGDRLRLKIIMTGQASKRPFVNAMLLAITEHPTLSGRVPRGDVA